MDILISSNLERLIYDTGGYATVNGAYRSLESKGEFSLDSPVPVLETEFVTDAETVQTIAEVYHSVDATKAKNRYIIDPHTAVAQRACDKYSKRTGDRTYAIIMATASPYKFPETVKMALGDVLDNPPPSLKSLEDKPVLHGEVIEDMRQAIEKILQ
jgi:threonine synthase